MFFSADMITDNDLLLMIDTNKITINILYCECVTGLLREGVT